MSTYAIPGTSEAAEVAATAGGTAISPEPLAPPDPPTTNRRRKVNGLISESLAAGGRNEPTALFCECGASDCFRVVWLSPADYEEAKRDPAWVATSTEHAVSAPGP